MEPLEIILGVLILITSILVVVLVLMQEGRQQRAVVADHEIAGVPVADERFEVVHLRHLVLNRDG